MKRLDIVIPHERLSEVNDILHKNKVGGITFYDIKGRGRAKQEPVAVGRGVMRYVPEFGSRTKIEVLVKDSLAKEIIDDLSRNRRGRDLLRMAKFLSMMLLRLMTLEVKKVAIVHYNL